MLMLKTNKFLLRLCNMRKYLWHIQLVSDKRYKYSQVLTSTLLHTQRTTFPVRSVKWNKSHFV